MAMKVGGASLLSPGGTSPGNPARDLQSSGREEEYSIALVEPLDDPDAE